MAIYVLYIYGIVRNTLLQLAFYISDYETRFFAFKVLTLLTMA